MRARETIRLLNSLIQSVRATEYLCGACAGSASSAGVKRLLRIRADEWGRQGDELQALVLMLGGRPRLHVGASAPALRAWLAVKSLAMGKSDSLALDTCQHPQLRTLYAYDHALSGYLPSRVRRTLSLQADRIADRSEEIDVLLAQCSDAGKRAARV